MHHACRSKACPLVGLAPIALFGALLLGPTGAARAQQQTNVPPGQDDLQPYELLQARFDRRGLQEPITDGPWTFRPQLQIDWGFNDNIFAQPTGEQSDFFFDLGARLSTTYRQDNLSGQLDLTFLDHEFVTLRSQDYWEGNARATLRDSWDQDLSGFLIGGVQRLAVPRTDPNPIDGLTPATYLLYDTEAGVTIGSPERNLINLQVGVDRSVYDTVLGALGPIDTRERNRTEVFGDFRYDHYFFGRQEWFAEFRPNTRVYDQSVNSAGFNDSSTGGRLDSGMVFDVNTLFLVTVSGGYQRQEYLDRRYGAIGEPDAIVDVLWSPTQLTQVEAKYTHEYFEDINFDSPGYIRNQALFQLQHELRRNFVVTGQLIDDYRDLAQSNRRYDLIDATGKAEYRFPTGFVLALSFDRQSLSSTTTFHFTDDITLLSLKKDF